MMNDGKDALDRGAGGDEEEVRVDSIHVRLEDFDRHPTHPSSSASSSAASNEACVLVKPVSVRISRQDMDVGNGKVVAADSDSDRCIICISCLGVSPDVAVYSNFGSKIDHIIKHLQVEYEGSSAIEELLNSEDVEKHPLIREHSKTFFPDLILPDTGRNRSRRLPKKRARYDYDQDPDMIPTCSRYPTIPLRSTIDIDDTSAPTHSNSK